MGGHTHCRAYSCRDTKKKLFANTTRSAQSDRFFLAEVGKLRVRQQQPNTNLQARLLPLYGRRQPYLKHSHAPSCHQVASAAMRWASDSMSKSGFTSAPSAWDTWDVSRLEWYQHGTRAA